MKRRRQRREGGGVGMRSRYNHGENYFQAPGRIISTPLRRLGREGGNWRKRRGWRRVDRFTAIEEAEADEGCGGRYSRGAAL